jgi:tRNA(Ile)-lysidine synthase
LTVDHRLQAASADWAAWCAARAARLGVEHRTLVWEGEKLTTPAVARTARHRLIAEAARAVGARVVLFGHTADDVLEAGVMREAGVRVTSPKPWSPSPVWPEGRDLFIARPLIGARRAQIREWLAAQGETWIEDPANVDPAHPRARARAALADSQMEGGVAAIAAFNLAAVFGSAGDLKIPLEPGAPLGEAIACASGAERPPRRAAVIRLAERLAQGATAATLGGARIVREGEWVHVSREARDRRGRACAPLALPLDQTVVWDGRFEATAHAPGLIVAPAADMAAPGLAGDPRVTLRNLVPGRMAGACGLIGCEAEIGLLG